MSNIKQLSREAAGRLVCSTDARNPIRHLLARDMYQPERDAIAAIIELVLTNSDLFREGYERAKEDAVGIATMHDRTHDSGYRCYEGNAIANKIRALTPDRKE